MYDIAREPMQPSEELGNESEITLELFGFVKQLAMTSLSPTARLETVIPRRQMPQAAKSYRATLENEVLQQWAEGRKWLKHDNENGVMFCEWCCCFDRNEHRNQFVKGYASVKLDSIKK